MEASNAIIDNIEYENFDKVLDFLNDIEFIEELDDELLERRYVKKDLYLTLLEKIDETNKIRKGTKIIEKLYENDLINIEYLNNIIQDYPKINNAVKSKLELYE